MPVTVLPLTARVVMTFVKDTREQVHVFHATNPAGWDATSLGLLAIAFRDWWVNQYRSMCSVQVSLTEVTATDVSVPNGAQFTLNVSPPSPGQLAGAPAPQNATQTISWRSGFSGRRNRGRSYTVGLNEGDAGDLDTINGTRTNGLAAIAAQLISSILAAGWELVVASYTWNQTRPILSAIVDNVVDSMRRRLPGRGR